jgi:hypothetical protein
MLGAIRTADARVGAEANAFFDQVHVHFQSR